MKLFLTRIINVLLIAVVLLVYQQQATARVRAVEECEEQNAAVMSGKAGPAAALFSNTHEEAGGSYQDGSYRGTGTGFSGDLTVEVTVKDAKITDVSIVDSADDVEYLDKASALLDEIAENQGADGIDAVSGATFSSNGILDAFRDAMEE